MYSIIRVDRNDAVAVEPLGTKRKFWFFDGKSTILFKAEERGTGEDWAEKVSCHLCELLGLPHVHYELAEEYDGATFLQRGVVCQTCAPHPLALVLGNQLLLARDASYPADESRKYKVRAHTIGAVAEAVRDLLPPASPWMEIAPAGIQSALDVFVGYIMLDAWIANQDRHHENWAALRDAHLRLAPTFDHGAALARNESDERRDERLKTNDKNRSVASFVRRARSAFYGQEDDARPLNTLDAFTAFARLQPSAAAIWLARLETIQPPAIQAIFDEVPNGRMTKISKEFTLELLLENQKRLLEETIV